MSVFAEITASRIAAPASPRFTVTVADDVAGVAAAWEALDTGSAYGSRAFLLPWITHVAPALGVLPRLGIVRESRGEPVAFLPFGLVRHGPVHTAVYLGGRDANLNAPLVAPSLALDEAAARALLRDCAAAMVPRPDLFVLVNQPRAWKGIRNSFVFAGSSAAASAAFGGPLPKDAAAMQSFGSKDARKKLRSKAAKLAEVGRLSFTRVAPAEAAGVIDTLTAQKQARLDARGIDAGLTVPHMRRFLAAMANPGEGSPALDLYALHVGTAPTALFGGLSRGRHWHGLVNSITDDPAVARFSPGDLLLRFVMGDLAERGFTHFDLGIGEARYKASVCPETIELFDTIVPITPLGYAMAAGKALQLAAKRRIKRTPWALSTARRLKALIR